MMTSSRRSSQFPWRLVGLVAGALVSAGAAEEVNTTVVIIGAGLSGLGAAKTLLENGVDFIVLEARDVLGGRVREGPEVGSYFKFKPGPYIIAGSAKTSGEAQVIYAAATSPAVNASLTLIDYNNITVRNRTGAIVDPEIVAELIVRPDEALNYCVAKSEELWEEAERLDLDVWESIDVTIADCFEEAGFYENITKGSGEMQVLQFMEWYDVDWEVGERATDVGIMWQLPLRGDVTDEDWFVKDQLVATARWLAGPVATSDALRLSQKVTKVTYSDGQVKVETEQGLVVNGKMVICTLPLGVLQKRTVEWDPPFSQARLNAIDGMKMSAYAKVLMQFPTVWWDSAEYIGVAGEYSSGLIKIILNFDHERYYPGSKAIQMPFAHEDALTIDSKSPEEVEAMLLTELRTLFPMETIPAPTLTLVSNWTNDEYTYGAWSNFLFNYTEEMWYDMLNSINNTVFFAGEHTSENFGYMHSAYETGVATVEEEILPLLEMGEDLTSTTEMSENLTSTTEMSEDLASTTEMMSKSMSTSSMETTKVAAVETTSVDGDASGAPSKVSVAFIFSVALLSQELCRMLS